MLENSSSEATDAVKAIASAIRLDHNLERLKLHRWNSDFTDEAGVALAEALTVNKTLRRITLTVGHEQPGDPLPNRDAFGVQFYEAFTAMLRVNTSLVLILRPHETAGADKRLLEAHNQMIIEQILNHAGRGRLLSSSQTTRKEWVDALNMLNHFVDESPEFTVTFLYSLLRLNPSFCMLDLTDNTNSGL
jgi:hypothetical protein